MKDLEKMLMKKMKGEESEDRMSDEEINAKMEVLMELLELSKMMTGDRIKRDMDEMQKVTVMAPDKEALVEGLEKAEDLVETIPETEESEENPEEDEASELLEEKEESSEAEMKEDEEDSMFLPKKKKEEKKSKKFSLFGED